jgi:hypothetical protein
MRRLTSVFIAATIILVLSISFKLAIADDNAQPAKRSLVITWEKKADSGPPGRSFHAMTYYGRKKAVMVFGGVDLSWPRVYYNDTWIWKGNRWRKLNTKNDPPARYGHTLVYDPVDRVVVMFGGYDGTNMLNDTWILKGRRWIQQSPTSSPSGRMFHGMAWDSMRNVAVITCGNQLSPSDTWEWDGTDWRDVTPTGMGDNLPSRNGIAMTFYARRGYSVIFGGEVYPGRGGWVSNETWKYDGSTWTEVETRTSPDSSDDREMVYLAGIRSPIMFGGSHIVWEGSQMTWPPNAEVWMFNGRTWKLLWPTASTDEALVEDVKRKSHAMAYDPVRDEIVVFSGRTDSTTPLTDTWVCTIRKEKK